MRRATVYWLGVILAASVATVSAGGAETAHSTAAQQFYPWLDKFATQPIPPRGQEPPSAANRFASGEATRQGERIAESRPEPFPVWVSEGLGDPVGPGEGLGCYYHRSYYSHLPLFQKGSYALPGSLAVAEPAHLLPQGGTTAGSHAPR